MKALVLACVVAVAWASGEKSCLEEPDGGMCRGYFPFYYYDRATRTCKEFIYGGCGGNGNRYATEEECMENCGDVVVWNADTVCDLPSDSGRCMGFFPRYFFDKQTGKCTRFIYGGCGGNGNNFKSEKECKSKCGRAMAPEACMQEKEKGRCRAGFKRWYYNKDTGKCESFIYGGCQGNSNNFNSQEDCEAVCMG